MVKHGVAVFISLFIGMIFFATQVTAEEKSNQLFILETSEATIYKELTIENGVVTHEATASRTSYQYNGYPNENLANIEMGHRSQSYNGRAGYRHYYSVLSDYVEEMLDVDYVIAGEYHADTDMINELLNQGFIKTSGTLQEDPMLVNGDLYLSGLIVLEYEDATLFNRVEIDYIGEHIFKMRSMMEPTLEYYGYNSVDEFIEVSEQHKNLVNGEGYYYTYYVDDTFLGETTEVKFFLMDVEEFFMALYGYTEAEYYERYPGGVNSVYYRVNDYLNRGYQIIHHEDLTPDDFDISDIDIEEWYGDMVEEIGYIEEESEETEQNEPEELEEGESEEVLEELEEDSSTEDTELEDTPVSDSIEEPLEEDNSIPFETPALPGIDSESGHILTYHGNGQTLQLAHQDGTISQGHAVMSEYVDESRTQIRLEEAYQTYQFFNDVDGINTSYSFNENVLEIAIHIDYGTFTLQEHYLQHTKEHLPIYMGYRLADVHLALLAEGYSYKAKNVIGESGIVTLLNLSDSTTHQIYFENGIVIDDDEALEQDIVEVLNDLTESDHIIIDVK